MSDDKNEISAESLSETKMTPLEEFRKWIQEHPEYPQKITDALLLRYLKVRNDNIEESRKLLEYNLILRKSAPQLFANRDFLNEEVQIATDVFYFCPLPNLTKEKHRITLTGLLEPDASKFDYVNCLKMILMIFDIRFSEYDMDGVLSEGEITILDMKDMNWTHFFKAVTHLITAKVFNNFFEEATPMKIVNAHIINPSTVVDKMFMIIKPFMKKEVLDAFHIHHNIESLYEFVPKELLPIEWGGNEEISIENVRKEYLKKMGKSREFLVNDENWLISEEKIN